MEQHTKVINNALNQVISRVEDLKTIPVSATGHIVDKNQSDQSKALSKRRKIFS
jgi:hypothetical protein